MYKTLVDKANAFQQSTINSEEDLQQLIVSIGNNPNMRYRGVNESKYTMLTSLQRNAPAKMCGHQKDYLSVLLYRVKSDKDVVAYFKSQNIPINDISCMALMQHLGLPTPLLDFSVDINVALSFAEDGMIISSGSDETDDYVSLYVIDLEKEKEVAMSVQQIYKLGMADGEQRWKDYLQCHPNEPVDATILFDLDQFMKWDDIKNNQLSFIEYQPLAPSVTTLSGDSLDLTNPNLSNQKGCFIVNLYDEKMPMEENWNMRTVARRNLFWQTKSGVQVLPFSGVMTNNMMYCYDIKKKVISKWAANNKLQLYVNTHANVALKQKLDDIMVQLDEDMA